jgi:hypothetical protein
VPHAGDVVFTVLALAFSRARDIPLIALTVLLLALTFLALAPFEVLGCILVDLLLKR